MIKTIYKYPLTPLTTNDPHMPMGEKILHVGPDGGGKLCVWALVDPEEMTAPVLLTVVGTGQPFMLDREGKHVGTAVMADGLVWHVFRTYGDQS